MGESRFSASGALLRGIHGRRVDRRKRPCRDRDPFNEHDTSPGVMVVGVHTYDEPACNPVAANAYSGGIRLLPTFCRLCEAVTSVPIGLVTRSSTLGVALILSSLFGIRTGNENFLRSGKAACWRRLCRNKTSSREVVARLRRLCKSIYFCSCERKYFVTMLLAVSQ